jgi:hypothetical protein
LGESATVLARSAIRTVTLFATGRTLRAILCKGRLGASIRAKFAAWFAAEFLALGTACATGFGALRDGWWSPANWRAIWSAGLLSSFSGLRSTFDPAGLGGGASRALGKLTLAGFADLWFAVLAFGGFAKVFDFFGRQFADFARLEIEDEGAVADAADFLDVMTDLFEHLAEFAVTTFDEDDFVPGIIDRARGASFAAGFAGVKRLDLGRGCLHTAGPRCAFGNSDAFAKAVESFFSGLAADFDQVGFFYTGGGAGELVGEFAVIGDEEEAFAQVIEAADWVETLTCFGEELHDGGPAFRVADSGDVTLGLVEHEVTLALGAVNELAVNADVIAMCVGFAAEFGDDLAIDLNAALSDEFFGVTSAGDAGLSEDLLEAL